LTKYKEALKILEERFGCDTLISLATIADNQPYVRIVDGYYRDRAFYVITHRLSNKMKQIGKAPQVAVCGEWFTALGKAVDVGHPLDAEHRQLIETLREVFSSWYSNGHVDEVDTNTCILKVELLSGVLYNQGCRYELDFVNGTLLNNDLESE